MLPLSASLASSDTTTQTTGPAATASAPVFSVVHQVGEGNTSNPTSSASATAATGVPAAAVNANGVPAWAVYVALGLGVAALLGLLLQRGHK